MRVDSDEMRALHLTAEKFRNDWQPDALEKTLDSNPHLDQAELLAVCLSIELEIREKLGDPLEAAHYRQRFPSLVAVVDSIVKNVPRRADSQERSNESTLYPPPPPSLEQHQLVGRFKILKRLGTGGLASVYLAYDPNLDREVALKIPKNVAAEQVDMIWREARAAAKLEHRAIVKIHEVFTSPLGSPDPPVYIEMQYIKGGNLAEELASRKMTPQRAVDLMIDIAEAVDFAHKQEVIHRDLKPENILLDVNGRPYVADFGLAIHHDSVHLHANEFSGTPAYMSPDQWQRKSSSPSDDIWSLGVILYRLLTYEVPFGSDHVTTYERILRNDFKRPTEIAPNVPDGLEQICLKCLQKNPLDRYVNVEDFTTDLRKWKTKWIAGPGTEERHRALRLERQAFTQIEAGLVSEAIPLLEASTQLYPDNAEAHYLLGLALLMGEQIRPALDALERVIKLNPQHASARFALANIYLALKLYPAAVQSIEMAIARRPANREYRQFLDRIRHAEHDQTSPTGHERVLLYDLPAPLKRQLSDVARLIFVSDNNSQLKLHHWTAYFPPWCWLKRSSVLRSIASAVACCGVVLLLQIPEWSWPHAVEQSVIWSLIAMGCFMPFVAARQLGRTYSRLVPAVVMPEDAFRRYFIEQCRGSFTIDGLEPQGLFQKIRTHRVHILLTLGFFIPLLYLQYVCANDHPATVSLAVVARYFSYIVEAYSLAWLISFAVFGPMFIPGFANLPLRFFLGMPTTVSLKRLGSFYLTLTALGTVGYSLTMVQHYVFHTHTTSPVISVSYIVIASAWLAFIMIISQWQIHRALRRLKERRLVEYSYHLEEAFEKQMREPTKEAIATLSDHRKFMDDLRRLDTSALSVDNLLLWIGLGLCLIAIIALYAYAIHVQWWLV